MNAASPEPRVPLSVTRAVPPAPVFLCLHLLGLSAPGDRLRLRDGFPVCARVCAVSCAAACRRAAWRGLAVLKPPSMVAAPCVGAGLRAPSTRGALQQRHGAPGAPGSREAAPSASASWMSQRLVLEREAPLRKTRVQYAKLVKIISAGLICLVSSLLVLEVCAACLFEHQFPCALKLLIS